MGVIRWILNKLSGISRKLALRSRWLAQRLWLVMVADVALTGWRHWRRLEPAERARLLELARKSEGRPSAKLSKRERREATELLDKIGHVELAGSVAAIVLPSMSLRRLLARFTSGRHRDKMVAMQRSGDGIVADPGEGGPQVGAPAGVEQAVEAGGPAKPAR